MNPKQRYEKFMELPQPAIMFHGAAGTVTGSMHLLHVDDKLIALDCGLFQGRRKEAKERNREFAVPPGKIDTLLLSHAHIDHSGNIPHLVKDGFKGKIYTTGPTADLCEIMLLDSGHIQEEDARYWNERRAKTEAEKISPLYTKDDAVAALKQFRPVPYGQRFHVTDNVAVTFSDAGHILGSAYLHIELAPAKEEGVRPKSLLYTGDLGRFDMPILKDPLEPLPTSDYLITESTYGGRWHENPTNMQAELAKVVKQAIQTDGTVIIPSFSVGRTQNVVYYLVRAIEEGAFPKIPIFVDSPLSTNATEIFRKHEECYDREALRFMLDSGDPFGKGIVKYITDVEESKGLNSMKGPHVILSASGMCEAGRILHHLKNNITERENIICLVGYMAANTLGRRIADNEPVVRIFGREYPVEATVVNLHGFSAHADQSVFQRLYTDLAPSLTKAFAVHGETAGLTAMKTFLRHIGCPNVAAPQPGDMCTL